MAADNPMTLPPQTTTDAIAGPPEGGSVRRTVPGCRRDGQGRAALSARDGKAARGVLRSGGAAAALLQVEVGVRAGQDRAQRVPRAGGRRADRPGEDMGGASCSRMSR